MRSITCSCLRPAVFRPLIPSRISPISKTSDFWAREPDFNCATRGFPSLSIPPEIVRPSGELSFLINSIVVRPLIAEMKQEH